MKLTARQREELEGATAHYQSTVAEAADYLTARGINGHIAKATRLGYVADPLPGHEQYKGRIAIPYLTPAGVVDVRYRCGEQHKCSDLHHPKYLSMPGHKPRLYNTQAVLDAGDTIAITEGEFDALIVTYRLGIPAVGVPGAQAWDTYYSRIFADFQDVLVFADADDAGTKLAEHITETVPHANILTLPDGLDVTDLYLQRGVEATLDACGYSATARNAR